MSLSHGVVSVVELRHAADGLRPRLIPAFAALDGKGPRRPDALHKEAFRQGLRAHGYVEGQNILIEARYADGRLERLADLAVELARLKVDVIGAAPTRAVRAVQRATRTIPIVMAVAGDPVGDGFAVGLARPGGNITGHSAAVAEITAKRVEFFKAIVPKLCHVAQLTTRDVVRDA